MRKRNSMYGFSCPRCGERQCSVLRTMSLSHIIHRVRRCEVCGHVFETLERVVDMQGLLCDAADAVEAEESGKEEC